MTLSAPIRLHAEYSLAWSNTAVILLLSLLFAMQSFRSTVRKAAATAQSDVAALCEIVDTTASSLANTPTALLHMLNNEVETSVVFVLNTTRQGLLAAIDGVDGLLQWFISIYKSTYVCLLTLAVDSSIDVATSISDTFESAFHAILSGGTGGIDSTANTIESAIIGNDTSQYGTGVAWLNITSNWTTALTGLDSKIHNWSIVDSIDSVLSIPFQDLKVAVNQSLWQFMQASNFTAAINNMSKVSLVPCNATVLQQDIQDVADKLLSVARTFTLLLIGIMVILSLLNIVCRYIVNSWRFTMAESFMSTSDRLNHAHAMLILRAGHKPFMWYIMSLLGVSPLRPRRWVSLSWLIDYVSQPAALFALAYGLSGVIFTSLAIKLVETIRDDAVNVFSVAVDDLIGNSVHNLSYALTTVATSVVSDTNAAIDTLEYGVNQDALGWVNTTTTILNSTLNQVSSDLTTVVTDIFGGTVLEHAAQGLVNCLLLNKIQSIEHGLTWLASSALSILDNNVSHIHLPRVSENFVTDAGLVPNATLNALLTPVVGTHAAHNGTLDRMLDQCISNLQEKLPFYWVLVSMWLLVLFMGVCALLIHNCVRRKPSSPSTTSRPSLWLYQRKVRTRDSFAGKPPARPSPSVSKAVIYKTRPKHSRRFNSTLGDDSHIHLQEL